MVREETGALVTQSKLLREKGEDQSPQNTQEPKGKVASHDISKAESQDYTVGWKRGNEGG